VSVQAHSGGGAKAPPPFFVPCGDQWRRRAVLLVIAKAWQLAAWRAAAAVVTLVRRNLPDGDGNRYFDEFLMSAKMWASAPNQRLTIWDYTLDNEAIQPR